ncbi:MAG: SMC family ATPase [Candidatus Latescibacterota bacterium]
MIPLRLVLQNFLSYGEEAQCLDFSRFHVACLSGPNGHGKSALLDAITWSLWGQARKGRHDRKPDEGLLRLGARQMRVEFTFELDGGTHRVIRSFRRRPSSNVTELELQMLDPETGVYRPLSEAGAVGVTQDRIDRLLSMDYETFVNSAFLLQGHADAFTSKGPRERKDLLARILGLGRYDRLQSGARERQQALSSELVGLRQRAAAFDTELVARPEVDAALERTEVGLAELDTRLERVEQELQLWRERRQQAESVRDESQRSTADAADLEGACRRLGADIAVHQERRRVDATILARADRIEADAVRYEDLLTQVNLLAARQEASRAIGTAMVDIRRQVEAARHQVDRRQVTWEARRDSLNDRLRQFDSVLRSADRIETDSAKLSRSRQELETLRRSRRRWEELRVTKDSSAHTVDLEQRRLAERRRGADARLGEILQRIDAGGELSRQIDAAENDLEAAGKRSEEMRRLREEGTRVRAQAEQARERLAELDTESRELAERITALDRGDLAQCPLCGTDLDADHRRRMDAELGEHEDALTTRRQRLDREAAAMDEELALLRARFIGLEESLGELAQLQQRVALLRARRRQLDEDETVAAELLAEVTDLTCWLQEGDFALDARAVQADAEASLVDLAFDPDRLAALEDHVGNGVEVDADHRLLQGARQDLERTEAERAQAEGHVAAAQDELDSGSFSRVLDIESERLRLENESVGYDEASHFHVRTQFEALSGAPVENERLRAARQRMQSTDESLKRLGEEYAAAEQRAEMLAQRRLELAAILEKLTDVDSHCQAAGTQVDSLRHERDGLLECLGSLQSRQQHLATIAEQATVVAARRRELERDEWLYGQLVEAFGKDGIQALVIESAIPEIEDEANAILRRLTDNRIQVTIESLRDLKGGGSRETLDVKIADELGERSYELYSGGEAFRTDFALRIALSKVLARRAGTRLRTLIIDEGFGTQDARGLEQLTAAIQQISNDFDKVLVVTHLDEMKDAFPVRIEVTKDPVRGSRFEIID